MSFNKDNELMKEICFDEMADILKKEVSKAGINAHSPDFLIDYGYIEPKKEECISFKKYCVKYFPERETPLYADMPDYLNLLLHGIIESEKEGLREGIKKLLGIGDDNYE